jgi:hypothetical protein
MFSIVPGSEGHLDVFELQQLRSIRTAIALSPVMSEQKSIQLMNRFFGPWPQLGEADDGGEFNEYRHRHHRVNDVSLAACTREFGLLCTPFVSR